MDVNIDYVASENWGASMHDRLRWLRENDPVYWSEKTQLWVITKYADVLYISKNHRLFCSGQGIRPGNPTKLRLIDEDEPRHGQLRGLINKGFTPRMVKKLEDGFRAVVTETIDKIADKGECDFVTDIAVPLPIIMIADLMGIRKEDRERFHRWSDALIAADGNQDKPEVMEKSMQAFVEYSAYVAEIVEERRRNPREDLITILAGAKDSGVIGESFNEVRRPVSEDYQKLVNDELTMILVVLMVAGNETTRNGLSGGMQLLIENPAERRKLLADPTLIPQAVEEMLRLTAPVHSFARTATEDTELRGRQIKKGQQVLMIYGSANRDAEQFEDPDVFKVERNPQHLAFGMGNHFCLGANLARMEMRVAFEELLRRIPDMEYSAGGPVIHPNALVRSCVEMKVRYTPEGKKAA